MPPEAGILDHETERKIQNILETCEVHTASISVRSLSKDSDTIETKVQFRTLLDTSQSTEPANYTVSYHGQEIHHIASITKALVATALMIAIEVKAAGEDPENPYAKFKTASNTTLTALYNKYSTDTIGTLPGGPTIPQFTTHFRGLPSSNHRLLAPGGEPIMTLGDVRQDFFPYSESEDVQIDTIERWTNYSNMNFVAIVLAIDALWDDGFEDFMNKTLFKPLQMNSTSIGFPSGRDMEPTAWVVDSDGTRHKIQRPNYQATGAEAGALGAYSTAHDLDIFFAFLLNTLHGVEVLPDCDWDIARKILKLENRQTAEIIFTPLGLFTDLDSSTIGSQSSNRLQFPEESFSTYSVMPGPLGKGVRTYYMAGSAIGCSCATAFLPSKEKESFAIVVLTDTSGPVDAADHILRLILRRMVRMEHPEETTRIIGRPKGIRGMVKKAMARSILSWKEMEKEDSNLMRKAPKIDKDIEGLFTGIGFSQRLNISIMDDNNTYMTVGGASLPCTSRPFRLIWVDTNTVKVCVPPHLSIDRLGKGDWSNLTFGVRSQGRTVVELVRKTVLGEDRFTRAA